MRVLVTSTPGTGHLHALAPLATALQAAGHDVQWATATEACERVRRYGFSVTPAGMSGAERRATFEPRLPAVMALPPRQRRALFFAGFFGWVAAPRMRVDLEPVFETFRPDVVVHERGELAASPMALARGIPRVTVAFSGALPGDALPVVIESLAPVWAAEGLPAPTSAELHGDLYLHPFPPAFGQRPDGAVVQPIRPDGFDGAHAPDAPPWLADLGVGRPAVYLTAGTEPAADAPWAAILEAVGSFDIDAVATIGAHLDPAALGPVPPNLRLEPFVPQRLLLDKVSVVASHAGAGSMLAAAGRGIPQLLYPLRADQWENADAAAGSGVAIVCELEDRSAADIGEAIGRLLREQQFNDAASAVAAEIAAMPPPSAHVETIQALVAR